MTWLPSTVCLMGRGFRGLEEDDDDGGLDDSLPRTTRTGPDNSDWGGSIQI